MGRTFRVVYDKRVRKDFEAVGHSARRRIKKAIDSKLTSHPTKFGKPLRGELKHYWSLRAGSYRIVYKIEDELVKVWCVAHRREVYEKAVRRLGL